MKQTGKKTSGKRLYVLTVICFHMLTCMAGVVEGTVKDKFTGETLPGTVVKVAGTTMGATTDSI